MAVARHHDIALRVDGQVVGVARIPLGIEERCRPYLGAVGVVFDDGRPLVGVPHDNDIGFKADLWSPPPVIDEIPEPNT